MHHRDNEMQCSYRIDNLLSMCVSHQHFRPNEITYCDRCPKTADMKQLLWHFNTYKETSNQTRAEEKAFLWNVAMAWRSAAKCSPRYDASIYIQQTQMCFMQTERISIVHHLMNTRWVRSSWMWHKLLLTDKLVKLILCLPVLRVLLYWSDY